jgi:cytochrome P450
MTEIDTAEHDHIARSNVLEPGEWYRELRARCPVFEDTHHDPPFYVLSKHDDVDRAVRQTDLWINRDGPGLAFAAQGVLQSADGDDHRRHRASVTSAFTSPAMRRLEPWIKQVAAGLFGAFSAAGGGDWIELFAKPLPVAAIAEILGVSPDAQEEFAAASAEIVAAFGDGDVRRYQSASAILRAHISSVIDQRLAALNGWDPADGDPPSELLPDDVSGMLAVACRRGELDYQEAVGIGTNLLIGGHETTTNLLALMVFRLAERPELLEQVRADRRLIPAFVEESLRYDSPTQGMFRTTTRETEVGGVKIPAGAKVQLLYAAANRDEDVWADPETFRLDRGDRDLRRHMAFGRGVHLCIGAPLARMEAAVMLSQLLDRFATVELAGDPVLSPPFILRGFTSMPIRWTLL